MCVVIVKASQLEYFEKYRIDIFAKYQNTETADENLEREINIGSGLWFPGRPVCNYNGKTLKTLTSTSDRGEINSEIPTKIFRKMGKLELFDRKIATPIVILDGHDSRFYEEFLTYINEEEY